MQNTTSFSRKTDKSIFKLEKNAGDLLPACKWK